MHFGTTIYPFERKRAARPSRTRGVCLLGPIIVYEGENDMKTLFTALAGAMLLVLTASQATIAYYHLFHG